MDEFKTGRYYKLKYYTEQYDKLRAEFSKRDLSEISIKDLYNMLMDLDKQISIDDMYDTDMKNPLNWMQKLTTEFDF